MAGGQLGQPEEASMIRGRTKTISQEKQHQKVNQYDRKNPNITQEGGKDLLSLWKQAQTLAQDGGEFTNRDKEQDQKIVEKKIDVEVSTQ